MGHQVKGFTVHLLGPVLLSHWSRQWTQLEQTQRKGLPIPGGHLKQNEGRAQAPAAPTQAWSSPCQEGARLVCPRSSTEPCFLMRAGFFNETICLAFLTLLSMMGPSISPVPIPVCLSLPRPPLSLPGSEGGRGSFRLQPSCLFFSSGHIWPPC